MPDQTTRSPLEDRERERGEHGSLVAFPRVRHPDRPTDNLPIELSSFVGREREIAEVGGLLSERRLLTLYGPGGCGKTRLALAVARDVAEGFGDGAWWVELAPISDPDLLPQAVASVLGVREAQDRPLTETLVEHLGSREALLIMDNCEHLVDASASLADRLLRSCPNLRVLATSREALNVEGETAYHVPSLLLPDPAQTPPAGELGSYESVRLFVERAQQAARGFELTEYNAPAVARLCRTLDGMPLAIELAAARARALSVEQISSRLEGSLTLLTGGSRTAEPRQRTLRAAIDWSHELLPEKERDLLRRLSVFAGGFALEAAEEVCGRDGIEPGEVLDLLSRLVDKSLVLVAEQDRQTRYGMLETVRQFAREKLEESGEEQELRRRHAEHYLAFAERAEPELLGKDQGLWLQRLRTEFGNLGEAQAWSVQSGHEAEHARLGLRLAAALCRFWAGEGFEEGKRWLRTALENDPGGLPAVRAKALAGLGWILLFQRAYGPAIGALEETIALYEEVGDKADAALALANLGYAALHGGYRERVAPFVEEGEALMQEAGLEGHPRAFLRLILASAAVVQGDPDSAAAQLKESLALSRELGNLRVSSIALFTLGMVEIMRQDLDRGATLLAESSRIARGLKYRLCGAYSVWGLGNVNALRGKPIRAARLWGAAEALRERMGMYLSPCDLAHSGYERDLAVVRSTLGEASFDTAWAEGRAMSFERALAYALEEPTAPDVERRARPPAAGTAALSIFALGHARVEKDGHAIDSPDFIQKPRELLYYLLSHPPRSKEQIGLALWPEASTSQLRSSFHNTVYRLRQALGAKEWIASEKGRYSFNRSLPYFFDVEAFEESLSEARRLKVQAPEQAIGYLQKVTKLYGGDFLEDFADSEWATERQQDLRWAYQEALLLLGELLFAQDRHAEAAEAYRKAIAHDAFVEEAHRGLMRCQAALGERGQALRHYEELVELLNEQLGASPAPETSALYEHIRASEEL